MKLASAGLLALVLLGGCASPSSGDDAAVKNGSGQVTNPGGKPASATDAAMADSMRSQGQQMSAAAAKDAAAMREAMQKSGGK